MRRLIALRMKYPILRRSRFFAGEYNADLEVKDVTWLDPRGQEKTQESWSDPGERCFGMVLDGPRSATGIVRPGSDATLLLIFNAYHDVVVFTLPPCRAGSTGDASSTPIFPSVPTNRCSHSGDTYQVTGRSLLMFVLQDGSRAAPAE